MTHRTTCVEHIRNWKTKLTSQLGEKGNIRLLPHISIGISIRQGTSMNKNLNIRTSKNFTHVE